jgi:hypothetical protein
MIFTGLMLMAIFLFWAPNIFALNKGHILRNIALWLAIFLGLCAFYQSFGPGSEHPLFQLPASMQGMNSANAPKLSLPMSKEDKDSKDSDDNGVNGFTPPKE